MNFVQYYIDRYQKARPWDLPDFAFDIKDQAMEWLANASFPSAKDEKYLYTKIAPVFEQELAMYRPSADDLSPDIPQIMQSDIPAVDSYSILIHNGYHRNNDPIRRLPGGIIAGSFVGMVKQFDHVYHDFFNNYELSDDVLVNLNTMLYGDGFFLFVPANVKPSKPIQVANLFDGHSNALIQPRNLVVMEAGSSAELLVSDCTLSGEPCVCNDVTEVVLGKAATLEMVRLQKVNGNTCLITNTAVRQAESSRMKTHYVTLSGGIVRNSMKVRLAGKKAEHVAGGLSLTQQTEHTDNDMLMIHESPDCQSNQMFKYILSDSSTGAFTGRIVVAKDAQKTVAYQRSSNILLHPEAKMNIRPQLEIDADDVKCSHGATVGQLDAEALFYLRSRGISDAEAKKTLLHAFAREVLNHISCDAFRESILQLITAQENFEL
ncbi:MAG: Fe-S cluster assembly protein SufD [Bacteroidales bacterium]|jgi:Fe-S cluster assembly protein SufD|nr:Fe-S cluster assembly protein SufD [Bacteroidales bacterium]